MTDMIATLPPVSAMMRELVTYISVIIILVMLVGGGVAFYVVQTMSKGLRNSVDTLEAVAKGKLDIEVSQKYLAQKDEIGEIVKTTDALRAELTNIISGIRQQSKDLVECALEVSERTNIANEHISQVEKAVDEIAQGATNQANETQGAIETIIHMGNMIEANAVDMENLNKNAESIKDKGEVAAEAIKKLQETNNKTISAIDVIYEQTNITNQSAQKIKAATDFITDIAEETNLLSLNASIEAARAGEHGRGFAVVAAQIQKLAEQSNASAKQIEEIILSLIADSDKAVATMKEVKEIMNYQSENVEDTDAQVNGVLQEVEQAMGAIEAVTKKTEEINVTRGRVVDAVQNLSAIAEENAASTEETSASVTEVGSIVNDMDGSAQNLKEISNKLNESIALFTIR